MSGFGLGSRGFSASGGLLQGLVGLLSVLSNFLEGFGCT